MPPGAAFTIGFLAGVCALLLMQLFQKRRALRRNANLELMSLTHVNDRQAQDIGEMRRRLTVLEQIATDPAERTAREIELLRDRAN